MGIAIDGLGQQQGIFEDLPRAPWNFIVGTMNTFRGRVDVATALARRYNVSVQDIGTAVARARAQSGAGGLFAGLPTAPWQFIVQTAQTFQWQLPVLIKLARKYGVTLPQIGEAIRRYRAAKGGS